MVPIAERMEWETYNRDEDARHDRETKENIGRTGEAISEVIKGCVTRMSRKYGGGSFKFAGFLLDNEDEGLSLHPLLVGTLFEEGQTPLFAMAGSDFKLDCNVSINEKGFFGKYAVTWVEQREITTYPEAPSFYLDGDRLMGYYHMGSAVVLAERGSPESVFPPTIMEKDLLALNEKVITLLAAATGIKPEDEKSETFPLLLKELKRIKAEKGK